METNRFDLITKTFAARHSRRSTLKAGATGLGVAVVGGVIAQSAAAQDATPDATDATLVAGEGANGSFLFVQTASGGTFRTNPDAGKAATGGTPTPGGGADYLLTLENHAGETIYFSDRPERVFGQTPTQGFLDGLGFASDNPPNAAIVAQTDGGEDVLVVELFTPTFDDKAGTLTYGANVPKGKQAVSGLAYAEAKQNDGTIAAQFTHASLFIDDCPDIVNCYSGILPTSVGPIPGGPIGTCYSWSKAKCLPCNGTSLDTLNNLCAKTYPTTCTEYCKVIVG